MGIRLRRKQAQRKEGHAHGQQFLHTRVIHFVSPNAWQ
jgi:hypothetical protein